MEYDSNFKQKLVKGQQIEVSVKEHLKKMLPDCEVINTNQEFGSEERDIYHLCDVVVVKDGKTILGIECKRSTTKFLKCKEMNGWDGDYNTPLNSTSLRKYYQSEFPFYVMNINQFCHKIFTADISTILMSRRDKGITKNSGVVIYNYDSSSWTCYDGKIGLNQVLTDILKKEKLC